MLHSPSLLRRVPLPRRKRAPAYTQVQAPAEVAAPCKGVQVSKPACGARHASLCKHACAACSDRHACSPIQQLHASVRVWCIVVPQRLQAILAVVRGWYTQLSWHANAPYPDRSLTSSWICTASSFERSRLGPTSFLLRLLIGRYSPYSLALHRHHLHHALALGGLGLGGIAACKCAS